MKKEELKKLRTLNATKAMMQKAKMDSPYTERNIYSAHTRYKYGIYMRCQQLNGYLKIACFLVDKMRRGKREPDYEIFIDPKNGEFITWNCVDHKWSNAKIDMLEWPQYTWYSGHYINTSGYENIKQLLGVSSGGYKGILEYQKSIRAEELKRVHRRETDPWDLDMEPIQDVPKDWVHWVNKTAIRQNYIFYQYKRGGAKEGWCTYCEKWVTVKEPRHNAGGTCKVCRRKITYKAAGKAGRFNTANQYLYLLQKYEEGFVIREFTAYRHYQKDMYGIPGTEHDRQPEIRIHECRRVIYTSREKRIYEWREYKDRSMRWCRVYGENYGWNHGYYSSSVHWKGIVYKRTLPGLKSMLSKTGLIEYIYGVEESDPEYYLTELRETPAIEKLAKLGLTRMVKELLEKSTYYWDKPKYAGEGALTEILGIDKFRLKRLREMNGNSITAEWLRYEKEVNTQYPDKCIAYFSNNYIKPKEIQFILDRMSVVKVHNYLLKQEKLNTQCRKVSQIIDTWEDYLKMAKRLKMDVYNELFYKPKNLKKAHDNAIELMEEKGLSVKAGEIADKYPEVEQILVELKEKYSYADKKFAIIIPEKIEDMLEESNALSLCMDRDDRYYERIQIRETYIAFLRKQSEPEQPWYVIEFEPNGTLRQESTVGDNKNKDFDEAIPFIKKWQRELSKRITKEDRKLAEQSAQMRLKEFEELRKNKNRIFRGPLQGKLLVDVLEQRLMEVEEHVG